MTAPRFSYSRSMLAIASMTNGTGRIVGGLLRRDLKNLLLDLVDPRLHVVLLLEGSRDDVVRRADELAQQVFFPDDVDVMLDVGGGRHTRDQIAQVGRAANFLKLVLVLQPLRQRDEVDPCIASCNAAISRKMTWWAA
jgi:hypothetical protein